MSAFTALNGGSPKATESPSIVVQKPPSEGSNSAQEQTPHLNRNTSLHRRESWNSQGNEERPSYPASPYGAESSHKRKRSGSPEVHRDAPQQERAPAGTGTAPHRAQSHEVYAAQPRSSPPSAEEPSKPKLWSAAQIREAGKPYEGQMDNVRQSQTSPGEQHGESSARNSNQPESNDHQGQSSDVEESSIHAYPYPSEMRHDNILQHDPKKRKRNFSNRTKTGCLTCRKRKKKCDEEKPECSNCIRGGFLCAGYPPQRGTNWQKPDNKSPAVPLESKDPSYVPPGAYGMPQQTTFSVQPLSYPPSQPTKRDSVSSYRGQPLRVMTDNGRPLMTDNDRPTASTIPSASIASASLASASLASASVASPESSKLSAMPYTPANPFPTPISANTQTPSFAERASKEYQRVPPLHDLSRQESEPSQVPQQQSSQLPQINIHHATRASSPIPHPAQSSNAQVAQMALSHTNYPSRRTQKEEMLAGRHFYPFDKELCLERERCAAACWKFNNLTNPATMGVSPDERARLFMEILAPKDPVRMPASEASPVTNIGRVGRHVAVETPFTCDYGYNIIIGNSVSVGRNCTINDVAEVRIGDNCVIGPNVSIYTASLPIDPKKRQGGQGPQMGRMITIEADCWIGGGAIILPGRTIGKGSTIGAGSIITKDVPPFTIVAGNPARVLRGIAS